MLEELPSSSIFHGPAAPAIPNTMLLTLQQMLPAVAAAATLILHPRGPMGMYDSPLIRAVDTKIAHLTFANTKGQI